jgi:hypothetical protein
MLMKRTWVKVKFDTCTLILETEGKYFECFTLVSSSVEDLDLTESGPSSDPDLNVGDPISTTVEAQNSIGFEKNMCF